MAETFAKPRGVLNGRHDFDRVLVSAGIVCAKADPQIAHARLDLAKIRALGARQVIGFARKRTLDGVEHCGGVAHRPGHGEELGSAVPEVHEIRGKSHPSAARLETDKTIDCSRYTNRASAI